MGVGMEMRRERAKRTLELRQTAYVDRVLERLGMSDCTPMEKPAEERLQLPRLPPGEGEDSYEYMCMVGCLMYLAVCTRPDIAFIVQVLSRYLQCAGRII